MLSRDPERELFENPKSLHTLRSRHPPGSKAHVRSLLGIILSFCWGGQPFSSTSWDQDLGTMLFFYHKTLRESQILHPTLQQATKKGIKPIRLLSFASVSECPHCFSPFFLDKHVSSWWSNLSQSQERAKRLAALSYELVEDFVEFYIGALLCLVMSHFFWPASALWCKCLYFISPFSQVQCFAARNSK